MKVSKKFGPEGVSAPRTALPETDDPGTGQITYGKISRSASQVKCRDRPVL